MAKATRPIRQTRSVRTGMNRAIRELSAVLRRRRIESVMVTIDNETAIDSSGPVVMKELTGRQTLRIEVLLAQ